MCIYLTCEFKDPQISKTRQANSEALLPMWENISAAAVIISVAADAPLFTALNRQNEPWEIVWSSTRSNY